MIRRPRAAAVLGALALLPAAAAAQDTPADSAGPRLGTWAAEVAIGQFAGGRLMRFATPGRAWLIGLDFAVTHERVDLPDVPFLEEDDESRTIVQVAVRTGLRGYRQAGRALRPFSGAGIAASLQRLGEGYRAWDAGLYGELGTAYFFSPHVSLGASGELTVSYGEEERGSSDYSVTRWRIGTSLIRVLGTVYF